MCIDLLQNLRSQINEGPSSVLPTASDTRNIATTSIETESQNKRRRKEKSKVSFANDLLLSRDRISYSSDTEIGKSVILSGFVIFASYNTWCLIF